MFTLIGFVGLYFVLGLLFLYLVGREIGYGPEQEVIANSRLDHEQMVIGPLVALLTTGSAAIFPVLLYSTLAPENSLTAYSAASGENSLRVASLWWPVGFALAIVYFVFISRRYVGKVTVKRDTQGYY